MRRALLITSVLAALLVAAPAAWATTQTAHAGNVTATFTFKGSFPNYSRERLKIAQGSTVFYNEPVTSEFCKPCAPALSLPGQRSSVHVIDLEHDGQPDVILSLYSGGAHCCTVFQIYSFDPGTMTYGLTERNFGDPLVRILDIAHNGRYELVTADDSFAYEFAPFAGSGLPIEILTYSGHKFTNVTRHYPKLVTKDAALYLKGFKLTVEDHYQGGTGLIAAWAADEDLLGHVKAVRTYLNQQAAAGHLNSGSNQEWPSGKKFVAKLQKFLRKHGYLK